MSRPVFHLCVFFLNMFTIVYDQLYITLPYPATQWETLPLNARVMFLTFWCLGLQTLYYLIAFLNDVFGTNALAPKKPPLIRKIKDTLFSLAFPIAIYVSLAFWAIYAVDKDLIFPTHIERLYPRWVNHVMHTLIAVFIFIELLTTNRNYPSRKTGFTIVTCFNNSYIVWMVISYIQTGVWVYPIFDYLNWIARVLFIIMSVVIALGFYLLGEKMNKLVCSNSQENYANCKFKSR